MKIQMMGSGMSVNSVEMWWRARCADHRDTGASKGTQPDKIKLVGNTTQFTLSILITCKFFSVTQLI